MRGKMMALMGCLLLVGTMAVPGAVAADAPKETPGQAQILHVTYYFLPG